MDAPWAERGVDATAVGVGADAVDAALDGLADVEAAADGLGEVDAMADLDATADAVAAVEALPAPATLPLTPHPASAARTTTNAAEARGWLGTTICIAAVCQFWRSQVMMTPSLPAAGATWIVASAATRVQGGRSRRLRALITPLAAPGGPLTAVPVLDADDGEE